MFGKDDGKLHSKGAISCFGVDHLATALGFYKDVLGLNAVMQDGERILSLYLDSQSYWVFEMDDYRPSNHPLVIFHARKFERAIEELTARGVAIEPFDPFEGIRREERRERNLAPEERIESMIVSFKDPAGNRFALMRE